MSEIIQKLSKPLTADQIDFRVQQVFSSANGTFALLLAYKNARADMDRLDEVCGLNWKREHTIINNNLFCKVSILNPETNEWITREDVGTASLSEASKGEASDSFKRACVNFGIGRELYKYPTIFITMKENEIQTKNGKTTANNKFLKGWHWENAFNEKNELIKLTAKDSTGAVRFNFVKNN